MLGGVRLGDEGRKVWGEGTVGQVQGHGYNTIVLVTSISEKKKNHEHEVDSEFWKNEATLSRPVLK